MDKKEKSFSYTTSVDLDIARMYASLKCKKCFGRGIIKTYAGNKGTIRKNQELYESTVYCNCVNTNVKKYG